MLLLRTTHLLIFNNISYQHVYSEQKNCWILGKTNIFSTLHQFSYLSLKNASDMYPSTNIHALFNRFAPSTCLLDFIFCPSNMFISSNMFINFCIFAPLTLLFHPTRLLGTLEYTTGIYFAYPWVTSFTFCLFTAMFVNIKKLLIYGLKGLKICHKFQHQNLQSSQGY